LPFGPSYRIPKRLEASHILMMGDTGSGKSNAIRQLLRQVRERGESAIVYDPAMDFVSEFYSPARGDLILNPLDRRCPYWGLGDEIDRDETAATIAAAFLPEKEYGRCNEFACCLRRMDVADPRLGVPLQLSQDDTHTFPMRLSHALVATDKGGERYGLWRGERSIPTGAMLYARHFLAEFALIGFGNLMANELRFRVRVLAFSQTRKMLIADRTF